MTIGALIRIKHAYSIDLCIEKCRIEVTEFEEVNFDK